MSRTLLVRCEVCKVVDHIRVSSFSDDIDLPADTPASQRTTTNHTTDGFYVEQIKAMKDFDLTTLYVDFSHVLEREEVLARAIRAQYYRFLPYLRRAVQALVRKYAPTYLYIGTVGGGTATNSTGGSNASSSSSLTTREFNIAFYNLPLVNSIRDLKMDKIGQLMSISGTVTRTSEVRPELVLGSFTCEECNFVINDVEQQFKYTEPVMCQNSTCNNRTNWKLNIDTSKFSDWQKVRIQENANEIPTGSMPRSLDVILRSEIVERAKAGDKSIFTGSFIVVPDVSQLGLPGVNAEMMRQNAGGGRGGEAGGIAAQGVTGLKALGVRDLLYKTAFLGCMVQQADGRVSFANGRLRVQRALLIPPISSLTDCFPCRWQRVGRRRPRGIPAITYGRRSRRAQGHGQHGPHLPATCWQYRADGLRTRNRQKGDSVAIDGRCSQTDCGGN